MTEMTDDTIAELLRSTRRIALVGASAKSDRASFRVMEALLAHGYTVIPVNPGLAGQTIHGQPVVSTLADITPPVDLVDIFRNSDDAGPVVEEAIAHGAKAVWMQLGVVNEGAAARARAAGLIAVMDRCPKIELARLGVTGPR